MDTSNSHEIIASEITPLIPAKGSKKPKTPLPKLQIGILITLQLAEPIASTSIFPYINQLIRELDITGGDDAAVGYYAGLIESLFFVGQALTVLRWARLSDRIGRKPVLVIGLSGICISMLCFGLSTTFWGLIISRCMCGFLNGNNVVMKTMMGELTDSTNMAQGFALIPIIWCVGGFVGPLMGGTLARPQDHWPALFSGSFWRDYPYFLPCAVAAFLLLVALVMMTLFLEETLSTKRRPKFPSTTVGVSSSPDRESLAQQSMANMSLRSLLTRSVVIPIANYAMLSFLDVSFRVLLPLFFSTPTYLGGLGFDPATIGKWMALCGITDGIFQAFFFARIVDWIVIVVAWDMAYGTIFLIITASAPTNNVLGAINGLGQTSAAVARAVGPALTTFTLCCLEGAQPSRRKCSFCYFNCVGRWLQMAGVPVAR
ncbi:MFS general substrate transporter [Suillus subluteus]|nr:MFS general substrate transporter [Suillus subluteus]